jgi:hypothetical protein
MEKKSPSNEPVEKTNKRPLNPGEGPKKNGNANNNWPKPESRTFE